MKRMKKFLLSGLISLCAGLFAVGGVSLKGDVAAAETPAYTTEDVTALGKITNVYIDGGNINMHITISKTDAPASGEQKVTVAPEALKQKLQAINFFDNVLLGEKTLTELGFSGDFWNAEQRVSFNFGEPKNSLYMSLHADPTIWAAACNAGEVRFNDKGSSLTSLTMKEGALIPGYQYLTGGENPVVYRSASTYRSDNVDAGIYNYGLLTCEETDIDSVRYVQGHDGTCGYFGFSLEGDDYLGDGKQVEFTRYKNAVINAGLFPNYFTEKILVNGQAGKVKAYSLFNLGEAGKGYLSAQMFATEEEIVSITIPKGTLFPTRYVSDEMSALNNPHTVWIFYETKTEKTYYKTEDGYVCLDDKKDEAVEALDAAAAEKTGSNYFAEDVTAVQNAVATAKAAIEAATDVAGVEAAYAAADAIISKIGTKEEMKAMAIKELNAYKGEEGYFRAAEAAERTAIVAGAETTINGATEKATIINAVATAKTGIDALKTAAQYADEELKPIKDAARATIEGYKADVAYLAEEAAMKAEAITAGYDAVKDAATEEAIAAAVEATKAAIDAIQTKAAIIDAAMARLNAYKAEEGYFLAAEATQRTEAIAAAATAFAAAENAADMEAAEAAAVAAIDALKTAEQYYIENEAYLAPFKAEAREAINAKKATVDYDLYSATNANLINTLYKDAKDAIAAAVTEAEIDTIVANFSAAIAGVAQDANASAEVEGGCGSVAFGGVAALVVALGVAMTLKKKED